MSEKRGTVGVFGASGFIGRALVGALRERDWRVVGFSRNPSPGDGWRVAGAKPDLAGLDAVINLAGESVAQRWSRATWGRIRESRVEFTRQIVRSMAQAPAAERPGVLLNASAVGFYGSSGDEVVDEAHAPGNSRLARLCRDWEAAAVEAETLGVRVVWLRTGLVFGNGGEAWDRLRRLFSLGLGGRLGSGRQWMPWIHLCDEIAAIVFALEEAGVRGPLNLSAPQPVTNAEFTRSFARALRRPALLHAPGFGLRMILGGFAEEGLLASCRAIPGRLEEAGFQFRYPTLEKALAELVADVAR